MHLINKIFNNETIRTVWYNEFIDFCKPKQDETFSIEYLDTNTRKIYNMLLELKKM